MAIDPNSYLYSATPMSAKDITHDIVRLTLEKDGWTITHKSFLGASFISEFHTALGQFINYQLALEEKEPVRTLYLAAPLDIYNDFFTLPFIQKVIQRMQLKLLI